MNIVKAKRLVIDLEITGKEENTEDTEEKSDQSEDDEQNTDANEPVLQQFEQNIEITIEEAQNRIENLYAYYQWFYVDMPYAADRGYGMA